MPENKNEVLEMGKTAFSLFSLKTKLIIIGVAIGIFIVVIFPVVAIMSIFSGDDTQSDDKKQDRTTSSTTTTVNEVISSDNMKKYEGAVFPMPFETWDSNRDVVTSKFSPSRTVTVNGVTQTKAHTGIDLVVISISNPKICSVLSGKVVVSKAGNTGYGNYVVIEHKSAENITFYTLLFLCI